MASEFYGINRGQTEPDVVKGTSTNSTDIEVRVDLTKGLLESEVLFLLETIINKIITNDKWPPA